MASSSYYKGLLKEIAKKISASETTVNGLISKLSDKEFNISNTTVSLTNAINETEMPAYTGDVTELDASWWKKNYKNIQGCTCNDGVYSFTLNGVKYSYDPKEERLDYTIDKKTHSINVDLYVAGKNVTDLSSVTTTLTQMGGDGSKTDRDAYTKGKLIKTGTLVCWVNWGGKKQNGSRFDKSDYNAGSKESRLGITNVTLFAEGLVKKSGGEDTYNVISGWSSGGQQAFQALFEGNKGKKHLYDEIIACNTSPIGFADQNFEAFKGVKVHICETVGDITRNGHDFTGDYLKKVKVNGRQMTVLEAINYYADDVDIYTSSHKQAKYNSIYKLHELAVKKGIKFNVVPGTDDYDGHGDGARFGIKTGLFKKLGN